MKKIPFIIILVTIISAIIVPVAVHASGNGSLIAQVITDQSLRPGYAVNIDTSKSTNRAAVGNTILQLIAGSLIYAAGPLAVLMIAVGGFRYVISHGDQTQMESAKKTITMAVIGLLIIIVSYVIVSNVISISQSAGSQTTQGTGQAPAAQPPQQPQSDQTPNKPAG